MDKRTITICDSGFLSNGAHAIGLDGERLWESPSFFDWQPADAEHARFVTDGDLKHARGAGQIALLIEPPRMHPEDYQVAWERRHEFDAVLAHSEAIEWGALWYPKGGSRVHPEHWGLHEKTRGVSMICGHKASMPGHKLRLSLREVVGDRVDVFDDNPNKMETLAPYRYSIVIENERQPGFFTEKLIDCISVGTIPIYWGADVYKHKLISPIIFPVPTLDTIQTILDSATPAYYERHKFRLKLDIRKCADFACCEDWIFTHYQELFDV